MEWPSKLKHVFTGRAGDDFKEAAADESDERPWWEKDAAQYREPSRGRTYDKIVDNRAFLLGLDELYREAMKRHERGELLACAQRVANTLKSPPEDVPVEGYYTEHPDLVTYFRLMRALQAEPIERSTEVESLPQFQRLLAVSSSSIFGRPIREKLLPTGRDPLSAALREAPSPREWTVSNLIAAASALARQRDDYSLVGLACRAQDPVVVAALRESVVLYAETVTLGAAARPRYVWRVDPELAAAGQRFIDAFNELFGKELPPATEASAHIYGLNHTHARIEGRCVRLGQTTDVPPAYYHWAVARMDRELVVDEFWASEIWTTERYRQTHPGSRPRSQPVM
jgi:hypothetical protein